MEVGSSGTKAVISLALLAVFCAVFAPSASSAEIDSMTISWADLEVQYVAFNKPVAVDIVFGYTPGEDVSSVELDASDLTTDLVKKQEYSSLVLDPETDCFNATCKIRNKVMRLNRPNVTIAFVIRYINGTESRQAFSKTFSVDNTRPQVTYLGTESCFSGTCYASSQFPSRIRIEMQDTTASFNRKKVAVRLDGDTGYAYKCTGLTCYAYATPECFDGQSIGLSVTNYNGGPSQDDAGNSLTGITSSTVKCDTLPPTLEAVEVSSSKGIGTITTDDTLIVVVNATDATSPVLNITVNGEIVGAGNVSATCLKAAANFVCTANLNINTEIPGDYSLPFSVTDIALNSASGNIGFTLLSSNNQTTVDIWNTLSVTQSANTMMRRNMVVQRIIYSEVALGKKAAGNPEMVSITAGGTCKPTSENETGNVGDITQFSVVSSDKKTNKVYVKTVLRGSGSFENSRYEGMNVLEYNCPLKITSKNGNFFYITPEEENFALRIQITDGNTLDSYVKEEIDSTKTLIEERRKQWQWYTGTVGLVAQVCKIQSAGKGVSGILSIASEASRLTGVGQPVATSLDQTSKNIDQFSLGLPGSNAFQEFCKFSECQQDFQRIIPDLFKDIDILNEVSQHLGRESFSDTFNPYKSEYIAYATACIPAIVHHSQVRTGIECTYLQCLTDGVTNFGASVSACQDQKAFNTCVYSTGSLLDALPGMSLIRDAAGRFADIIKNPVVLFGTALPYACRLLPPGTGTYTACNIYVTATTVPQMINTVRSINFRPQDASAQCTGIIERIDPTTKAWKPVGTLPNEFRHIYPTTAEGKLQPKVINGQNWACDNTRCGVVDSNGQIKESVVIIPYRSNGRELLLRYSNGVLIGDGNAAGQALKSIAQLRSTKIDELNAQLSKATSDAERMRITSEIDVLRKPLTDEERLMAMSAKLDGGVISVIQKRDRGQTLNAQEQKLLQTFVNSNPDLVALGIIDATGKILPTADQNLDEFLLFARESEKQKRLELLKLGVTEKDMDARDLAVAELAETFRNNRNLMINSRAELERAKHDLELYQSKLETFEDNSDVLLTSSKSEEKAIVEKLQTFLRLSLPAADQDAVNEALGNSRTIEEVLDKLESKIDKQELSLKSSVNLNNEEIESQNKRIQNKEDAVRASENKLRQEAQFKQYFGSVKSTIKTMWGVGAGLSTMIDLFDSDWLAFSDGTAMGAIRNAVLNVAQSEVIWCESELRSDRGSGEGVVMNAVGPKSYRNGAYITARRSGAVTVSASSIPYYDYWIEGGVTITKNSGLPIKVLLYDATGTEYDFTQKVTGRPDPLVFQGTSLKFGGYGRSKTFNSTSLFTKACIRFETGNMREYFDYETLPGNTLCQTVIAEEY